MPTQIVMDHSGDTRHSFDATDAAAIEAAEKRFQELTGAGFFAYKREGEGKASLQRKFDPAAEEVVFRPMLKGG